MSGDRAGERRSAAQAVLGLLTEGSQARVAALAASEERFRFLDRIGEATRPLDDPIEVMAVTARLLGEHLGATRCAYADVEADNDRFTIRNDWTLPGAASSVGVYSLDLFGPRAVASMRAGGVLVVRDVDRELAPAEGRDMFNAIGVKAIVCMPLVKGGRLVAMMAVHQAGPRDWSDAEIALVGDVVERCWAHIERVRAHAMLREQDRRKNEFLAILAHELRNPLAPVRYALAVLRATPMDDGPARQAREVMERQVAAMSRLIDDLLDISRIERGLVELRRQPVTLESLVASALEAARPVVEAAGHRLSVALSPEPLMLQADPVRITQVISNLLHNAAKYTPRGGQVQLQAGRDGDHAVLQVQDDGIGIPPEMLQEIFETFRQVPGNESLAQGGLGIGLSLARQLVLMHGGTIEAHSEGRGCGSLFVVRLPLSATP